MSEFYNSGGMNDSTGRENFEDTTGEFGAGAGTGTTNTTSVGNDTTGQGYGNNAVTGTGGQGYGDNSVSGTAGQGYGENAVSGTAGQGYGDNAVSGSTGRGYGDNVGSDVYGSAGAPPATADTTVPQTRSAGAADYSETGSSGGNPAISSGVAGTDKFDSPSTGSSYGEQVGDKETTNQDPTRHGSDFTGGFAATGGAYTNEYAKTGLTGRETTTTGVNDKDGNPTQKTSMMGKIKNALGGHKNDDDANES